MNVIYDHWMLTLKFVRALDAVATAGGFRGGARRLHFSQSTLSQQIAALERSVGGRLLERGRGLNAVTLTPLGELVLEVGRDLLHRADAAERRIDAFLGSGGRLSIATFQSITATVLPELVQRLRAERPGCDIRLIEEETETPPVESVDLAFFDGPGRPDDGVEGVLLLEDPHVLIARRGTFAAGTVALERLDGAALVALPPITTQRMVETTLAMRGIRPDVVFRTADNQGIVSMVRAGLGCAVMPRLAVQLTPDDPHVAIHPIEPPLPPRPIHLLWRPPLSDLAARGVDLAIEIAGRSSGAVTAG
jgi:DNA-binding transcriptional LysR family regulator